MSDIGEMFEGLREQSQIKRAKNRESSAALLKSRGIPFTSHNDGAHLVVDNRVDFWPGTGKWIFRKSGKKGRGVFKLLKHFHHSENCQVIGCQKCEAENDSPGPI